MFLCEFSLVLDISLNRRHIVFTDGNLPLRRRYLALKIGYYNNSDASYQLQRLVLSGDTGVSLNPGPGEYSFNDNDEQLLEVRSLPSMLVTEIPSLSFHINA